MGIDKRVLFFYRDKKPDRRIFKKPFQHFIGIMGCFRHTDFFILQPILLIHSQDQKDQAHHGEQAQYENEIEKRNISFRLNIRCVYI
ncbi:hypothetical protein SDC9_138606 [bioreactor metagenome]|uniref:Uncharacterized protein n=1 Tax=bioreactor metagenome TaxID=1076179 RepID=A0A645DQ96_9ZZZZ